MAMSHLHLLSLQHAWFQRCRYVMILDSQHVQRKGPRCYWLLQTLTKTRVTGQILAYALDQQHASDSGLFMTQNTLELLVAQ